MKNSQLTCGERHAYFRDRTVDRTRIGVHDVIGLIVNGSSVDDVVRSFPDLTRAQVYECLAYYEDHRGGNRYPDCTTNESRVVKFFLDHDVPVEVARVLPQEGHDVTELREVYRFESATLRSSVTPANMTCF